jgi:hypothetical protein
MRRALGAAFAALLASCALRAAPDPPRPAAKAAPARRTENVAPARRTENVVVIVTGEPTEDERQGIDIAFGSNIVISIAIGYSFR